MSPETIKQLVDSGFAVVVVYFMWRGFNVVEKFFLRIAIALESIDTKVDEVLKVKKDGI